MKSNPILEAALAERQEYLESLIASYKLIQEQISILEDDIDELLYRLMEQSHE
jgi:prefoldin subunit 5